ncbi:MAG: SRPBCC family protein [Alphaproteobacteria bacterium]|nr:SRPBCC family protein [Alphaproteobacteria bacterium]
MPTITATTPIPENAIAVRKDFTVDAPVEFVWSALRDFGALTTRLVRGFVTECRLEGTARIVTFANGSVAREELVEWDDAGRRLVYTIPGAQMRWHRASAEVSANADGTTRFVWTTHVVPAEIGAYISEQMDLGVAALKATLEEDARAG